MRLGIMQPYFFPYVGYFQLIRVVDKFVFYDDVNFIKNGWINRNNILVNGEKKYITIPLKGASPNKKINDIMVLEGSEKILKTIKQNYSKSPFFKDVFKVIEEVLAKIDSKTLIYQLASSSIICVSEYLGLNTEFEYSSNEYSDTKGLERADRLIEICKRNDASEYINAAGGKELYSKEYFSKNGIKLQFIKNNISEYKQFKNKFVPNLSIIDVMMFNSPEKINEMLDDYELI